MKILILGWVTPSKLEDIRDDDLCKNEFIDLQSSTNLHDKFNSWNRDFPKFWYALTEGSKLSKSL